MRQVGLVDVSCCNILLAAPDLIEVRIPRLVGMKGLLIEGGEILERQQAFGSIWLPTRPVDLYPRDRVSLEALPKTVPWAGKR